MVARWFFCSVVLIATFAGSRTEAAYFGNDIFVGNLYGNEVITIPRQTARKLGDNMMRRSVMMTNSVSSFLSNCNFEELAHLTNGTFLVSAFYHQFDVNEVAGWALSLSLFKAESAGQGLVQFAILPDGTIVKSRLPRQGEVYVIKNEPIEIDQKDFEGIIPVHPGMRKNVDVDNAWKTGVMISLMSVALLALAFRCGGKQRKEIRMIFERRKIVDYVS